MANWDGDTDWTQIARNPAQPAGLTQAAADWSSTGGGPRMPWEEAKSWWGGRNMEGPGNGWDTDWLKRANDQFALYQGDAATGGASRFFNWLDTEKNPQATGVALWTDEARGIRKGDVFDNGVKQDNLFDIMDEHSANMMMGAFMFDADEQVRMNKDGDPAGAWKRAVDEVVERNTDLALNAESAEAYDEGVRERQQKIQEGLGWDEGLAAGAGLTTFAAAAVPLAGFGPAGWIAAGAIGLTGLAASYLNRDQVSEVAARAWETADVAAAQHGGFEANLARLEGIGAVGSTFLQPAQNLVQGIYDGTRGDGMSKYYESGDEGRPAWLEPLNLAASVVDAFLTFSSPVSAGAYMASMGMTTAGSASMLSATNSVFNERTGKFDPIEDAGEFASAWGAVGIDAVQMLQAGALTRAAGSARRVLGGEAAKDQAAGISRPFAPIDALADRTWAGIRGRRDVLAAADDSMTQTINGIKFFRDKDGVVLGSRLTTQALAPSEFVRWIPTGWRARTRKALDDGQTGVDDLYRAALHLTSSGSRFGDAVITGYAESVEELVQAYLEPRAVGETATWQDLSRAAMYGATSGFGMSLGRINARPSSAEQEMNRAMALHVLRTGEDVTKEQWRERWSRMSTQERARMSVAQPEEAEEIQRYLEVMGERMEAEDALNSPFSVMLAQDLRRDAFEKDMKNPRADNTLSLKGRTSETLILPDGSIDEATYRADEAVMSSWQVVDVLRRKVAGYKVQRDEVEKLRARAAQELKAAQDAKDADGIERWTAEAAELEARADDTADQVEMAEHLHDRLRDLYNTYRDETDRARAEALIDQFNSILDSAWSGTYTTRTGKLTPHQVRMVRRAAEFQTTRHPLIDTGSFSILRMRASKGLSRLGSHGSVHTHQSLLKVIGGDHDGDNRVTLNFMYLDPGSRRSLLLGKFAREKDVEPDDAQRRLGIRDRRTWVLELDRPDGEEKYLEWFAKWSADAGSDQAVYVQEMIDGLKATVLDAYSQQRNSDNPFDEQVLSNLLNDLESDIKAGVPDAVVKFTEALMNHSNDAYEQLHLVGERNNRMELPWLMQQFNQAWDTTTTRIAHYNYTHRSKPRPGAPAREQADRAYLRGKSILRSVNLSEDMNLLFGSDPTRNTQHSHYTSLLHAAVDLQGIDPEARSGEFAPEVALELARAYMLLGSGQVESDLDAVRGRDRVERRVLDWLAAIVDQSDAKDKSSMMMVLANTAVADVEVAGENLVDVRKGEISLLQLLLRRSIQLEEATLTRNGVPKDDPQWAKVKRLKGMTRPQGPNSYSASQAMLEIFGGFSARDLIGDAADPIGPNVTLNQYMKALIGMNARDRNKRFEELRSPVAGYVRHRDDDGKRKDPPFSAEVFAKGLMNPYSVMVDAMRAVSQNQFKNMKDQDAEDIKKLEAGFAAWQKAFSGWREKFGKTKKGVALSDEKALEDFLQNAPPEMSRLLMELIPQASRLGVAQIVDGRVYVSKWIKQMLLETNEKKAAKTYFVMSKLEEWRVLGGMDVRDENGDIDPEAQVANDSRKMVQFGKIKSRFLQTMYHAARDPMGLELQKFLALLEESADIQSLMDAINSNPQWLGNREKLLALHDDVALFESDPKDVWSANLPGSVQREAIQNWGDKIGSLGTMAVQTATNRDAEQRTLKAMAAALRKMPGQRLTQTKVANQSTQDLAVQNLILLQTAIQNRRDFPDFIGPNAREQYFAAVQEGLIQMHNKGAADRRVAPMGEPLALTDAWGAKQGLPRELDSITRYDFRDILSNPTDLVNRPVLVMMPDGSEVKLDFTTVKGALEHLMNPRTNALAKAVLFPTVRDVNSANVSQVYLNVEDTTDFTKMLQRETFVGMFEEWGSRPSVEQAHEYIGFIEAHIRGQSRRGTPEDREYGQHPIMNMIDDFLVAYNQTIPIGGRSSDKLRKQVVIEVAMAIRDLTRVAEEKLPDLRKTLEAAMSDRFYKEGRVQQSLMSELDKKMADGSLRMLIFRQYQEQVLDLMMRLEDTGLSDKERAALQKQFDEANDLMEKVNNTEALDLTVPEFRSAQQILDMYKIDWSQDPQAIEVQKKKLVELLTSDSNFRPFRDKKTYNLINKALQLAHENPNGHYDDPSIKESDWNTISGWVVQSLLLKAVTSGGSGFASLPNLVDPKTGELNMPVARYMDKSFSYLVEPLFDERILTAARRIQKSATDYEVRTDAKVAESLENGLFNADRYGNWNGQVPIESLKLRKVLGGSPVGLGVAVAGIDPVAFADYVGGSILTTKKPTAQHMSTAVLESPSTTRRKASDILNENPMLFVKLQNHFVKSVRITSSDPRFAAAYPSNEFVSRVGHKSLQTEEVENSDYYVLNIMDLDQMLSELERDGLTDFRIEIDYVDVDKKPWTREWAHNLYFDGVGRESSASSTRGPIASLIFALGGISKIGQQEPLNYATKGGSAYAMYTPSDPGLNEDIERTSATVTEYMARKALHMWGIEYDTGPLLGSDLPSLYKLVKMRHIVEVVDPKTNTKVFKWPEEIIFNEASGTVYDMSEIRIIPLSDSVARTLWGGSGWKGVDTGLGEPLLNLQDIDRFPSLDAERLESLGLTGLGKSKDAGDTAFAQVVLPPRNYTSDERGTERKSLWKAQEERWEADRGAKLSVRSMTSREGVVNFNPVTASEKGDAAFADMVVQEKQASILSRLGVPFAALHDLTRAEIGSILAQKIGKLKTSSAQVTWQHIQDGGRSLADGVTIPGFSLADGILTGAESKNGFSTGELAKMGPTFGDIVVLHLDSFIRATSTIEEAYREVQRAITVYANRGVTVAMASPQGHQYFRNDIADWLDKGSLGYGSVANSRHIYAPVTENSRVGRNEAAIRSRDLAVGVITPRHVTLNFASDLLVGTGASENSSYTDFDNDPQWKRTSAVIVPTALMKTDANPEKEHLFNVPKGAQRDEVTKRLLRLLNTSEGRKWLAGLAKDKDGNANPEAPEYRENAVRADGTRTIDPGVVFIDHALVRLRNTLEAGKQPLDANQILMVGDLIPLIDQQGNIYLQRHGFTPLRMRDMEAQFKKELPGRAERAGKISLGSNKLADQQTVTPPMLIERTYPDPLRGLTVEGEWDLDPVMKKVWEGLGFKSGAAPMPENWVLPGRMSRKEGNHIAVTQFTSEKAIYSKGAVQGLVDNFSDAFAVFGIDFRPYLVDYFYGKDPSRDDAAQDALWNDVQVMLQKWSELDHQMTQQQVESLIDSQGIVRYAEETVHELFKRNAIAAPRTDLSFSFDGPAEAQLAMIMLAVLAGPGVKLDHIISTSGLLTVENNASIEKQILQMPTIFTDALDNAVQFPELRKELFRNINDRFPRDANGESEYLLTESWDFYMKVVKKGEGPGKSDLVAWEPGKLQYILPLPASENPAGLTQSGIGDRQMQTQHVTNVINAAAGGRIAIDPHKKVDDKGNVTFEPTALDRLYRNDSIWRPGESKFTPPGATEERDETFYDMLTRVNSKDATYSAWARRLPAQEKYLDGANEKRRQYRQPIDRTGDDWDASTRSQATKKQDELLTRLGLTRYGASMRTELDYMVRQFAGRPGPASDQDENVGKISGQNYVQILDLMLTNVRSNRNPLHGGIVFVPDRNFMQTLYKAQLKRPLAERWAPLAKEGKQGRRGQMAKSWDEWVSSLLGQFKDSNQEFLSMFLMDVDGFFHTWHGARPGLGDLPISFDTMRELRLMNAPSNDALLAQDPAYDPVLSLDPGREALLHDPIILDSMKQTLDTLLGHEATFDENHAKQAYASPLREQLDKQKSWLASNKLAKQRRLKTRDYMAEGVYYTNTVNYENQLMKNLVNLSLTMRLANPGLWVSALVEVPARNMLEHITNTITGRGISGGPVAKAMPSKYTDQEIQLLQGLAEQMGQRKEWMSVLYDEMTYQQLVEGRNEGSGSLSRGLEKAAAFTARATSDPRYGMKATSVAKRYIEAAMEYFALSGTAISVEQFVAEMSRNPMWLRDQYEGKIQGEPDTRIFNPHRAGMNRVAQVRSTKQTVFNKIAFGWIDGLSNSSSGVANISGHLLKIPFMFTRFNINALMTVSGLTAFDQVAAMLFDKRKKPAFLRKAGKPDTWDYTDVIETLDLHRTFVRSGMTYSMVMALGMMAGNLGLGGDDEEERRRERLSRNLGLPVYRDPLDAANDFRLADAVFLDSVPFLKNIFDDGNGNAVVVPHWIVRQFTSPILGIQRFFETGNLKEISNGFLDAFSAIPNTVIQLWDRADVTALLLAEQAQAEAAKDTPQGMANANSLLISIVGVYERALFENMFANSIRNALDKYDRNPYAIPGIDPATGEIARYPGTDTPMSQEEALVAFRNEDGDVQQGYMTRQGKQGELYQYAENNLTFALVASLFSGLGDSPYLRKNMVPREQRIEVPDASQAEIEALVFSAYKGSAPQPPLSKLELIQLLKQRDQAAGKYWQQAAIEEEAEAIFQAQAGEIGALSTLDAEAKEVLTLAGTESVFWSLGNGTLEIGDKALQGFSASYEMREAISVEWGQRLVQEGLDMGLSYESATFRAKRFWYGDEATGAPGLGDILWDKAIPYDNDQRYFQLNHMYTIGPDGKPWATPFPKMGMLQSAGLPIPTQMGPPGTGLALDERGNIIDTTLGENGINTGLAGLERKPELVNNIKRDDDAFEKGMKSAEGGADSSRKFGYTPWRRFGRSGYGGGGGGGGGYTRDMRALPGGAAARFEGIQMINSGSPYIRRANVNRQRIWSERGRLKQWQ